MEQYALVTGASKGIGMEIARELAARSFNLVLVARSADLLAKVGAEIEQEFQVKTLWLPLDLSLETAADDLFNFCQSHELNISVLINNAGYSLNQSFQSADVEDWLGMNDLNVKAVVKISHLFLPLLLKNKKSYLLNVSSLAAYMPMPYMSLYAAGKAYVLSFTLSLREELKGKGIKVCALCPGGVRTDFPKRAGNMEVVEKTDRFLMDPDQCARTAVKKLFRGKAEIIPGWINRFTLALMRFAPKILFIRQVGKLFYKSETT